MWGSLGGLVESVRGGGVVPSVVLLGVSGVGVGVVEGVLGVVGEWLGEPLLGGSRLVVVTSGAVVVDAGGAG
ncbi:hypothetical protein AAHZ94_35450, partial [Streptomyces sp. HSW2009]|uniref:hypothetical protein n=1 Tax=Streptomyces sp. HSW2009 TaxID=3142890 RepID=UPI0032EB19D7